MGFGRYVRFSTQDELWVRRDAQQDPPAGWCPNCGAEDWTGEGLCEWCKHLEEMKREEN